MWPIHSELRIMCSYSVTIEILDHSGHSSGFPSTNFNLQFVKLLLLGCPVSSCIHTSSVCQCLISIRVNLHTSSYQYHYVHRNWINAHDSIVSVRAIVLFVQGFCKKCFRQKGVSVSSTVLTHFESSFLQDSN